MLTRVKLKSEFYQNVLTLVTGNVIGQAIPIAIMPILTRLYTPEQFGIFALYMSVASVFAIISTGRYELAIMLPEKDEDANAIAIVSLMLSFIISLLSLVIVLLFNDEITNFLANNEISKWLYFIPLTVLATGVFQSFTCLSNRKKHYKRMAASKVIQGGVSASSSISLGIGGFGSLGLISGQIIGQAISSIVLYGLHMKTDKAFFKNLNKINALFFIVKYKKFPLLNLPNALIDSFRLLGISVLISRSYTVLGLGQFSLAWRMLQVPVSLIGGGLSQVFFQRISRLKDDELYKVLKHFLVKLSLIALPIFMFIFIFAADIFLFVFGEAWLVAGELASVMAPWMFFNFVSSPVAYVFLVLNKQEIVLAAAIVYMALPVAILFLMHDYGLINVIRLISIGMSLVLVSYIAIALLYVKRRRNNV